MRSEQGTGWRAGVGRWERSLRDARQDVAFEVVRAVSALFAVVALAGASSVPDDVQTASTAAHVGLIAMSVAVLAALPVAVRRGQAGVLRAAVTVTTIVFFVVTAALWHDVAGAGSTLGIVALLEAPVRYGWRGAALSGFPVLWTALLLPQVDATGRTMSDGMVVSLVALLLAAAMTVREVMRRSVAAVTGAAQGFAEAMLHLPLGVALLDEHGRVLQSNPALSALLGPVGPGDRLADHLDGDGELERVLDGRAAGDPVVCRTPAGRELEVGGATVHVPGPRRTVVHLQDVTDERRQHRDLLHASRHDALTGLLSRAAGTEALDEVLAGSAAVGVLFLDLDGFKGLNDSSGHAVGDAVLRQAAGRLSGALRATEQAVRWGGDEFVVVCPAIQESDLGVVAHRLLTVLREPFHVREHPLIHLTASVGAVRAEPGTPLGAVLAAADSAMYEAKRAGGDRWALGRSVVPAPRAPETVTLPDATPL